MLVELSCGNMCHGYRAWTLCLSVAIMAQRVGGAPQRVCAMRLHNKTQLSSGVHGGCIRIFIALFLLVTVSGLITHFTGVAERASEETSTQSAPFRELTANPSCLYEYLGTQAYANMAAEPSAPWVSRKHTSTEYPCGPGDMRMRTISEEMDDDLEMIERSAQTARPPLENLTSAQPAMGTTSVMREVVVDPRLLTKPGDCHSERGTLWRLWRSKMEG